MKRTLCFFILMFSTCGCIFYGGTSSLVLNAEVWQHWKSGKPIVLTQDFTVVHTFGPLKDKNRCFSKSFDGMIPTNLLETCYVLPKGTKIYVKDVREKKDFIEIILPIFPIYIRSYYEVLFTESAEERDMWKEELYYYGFKRESDILKMLQDGSL